MFVLLLVTATITVSSVTAEVIKPMRTAGPAVKRWSGYVLIAVGIWFVLLSVLPDPILGG